MSLISPANFQELCRACLRTLKENNCNTTDINVGDDSSSSQLKSLLVPNLCKLFMFLTAYDVNNEKKDFPKRLCEWCYNRLLDYEEFRKLVTKSSVVLYERWNDSQLKEKSSVGSNSEEMSYQIKREDDEIGDDQLLLPELANLPVNIKEELSFDTTDTQLISPSITDENYASNQIESSDSYENANKQELVQYTADEGPISPNIIYETSIYLKRGTNLKNLYIKNDNIKVCKMVCPDNQTRVTCNIKRKMCECSDCKKSFKQLHLLTEHMKLKHNEAQISPEDPLEGSQENKLELSNFCNMCRRNYSSKRALKEHIKRHKKIKEHVCKECGVAKVTRTELATHMRTHIPNLEKFPCPQCPKEFNHKNAISRHIKVVHEGLRRYPCTYCSKRFGTRNSQIIHERLHTGERPFSCEICKRDFAQQEALKSHMKNHDTNLRTHICKYCSRRFITRKNVKDHEMRHLSDKPHICKICSKGFAKQDELLVHFSAH